MAINIKLDGSEILDCKCPKCRQHHKMLIYWTGKGTPWKFCKKCLPKVQTLTAGSLQYDEQLQAKIECRIDS